MTALRETTFASGDDVLSALDADGAVIVHDFLDAELLRGLRTDLFPAADARPPGTDAPSEALRNFWGERTTRFTRLGWRTSRFVELLSNEGFLAVNDALLLPHCTSYWMNTAQAIVLAAGERAQHLHRDADNWPQVNRPDGPEVTVSCVVAIDDFTEENGATCVVPGSHRWDDFRRPAGPDDHVLQAVMPSGSAVVYTGRVLHGGGANRSPRQRFGLHLSFVLGWLTPEEALPLSIPWDVVADQPFRVQQLVGWRSTTFTSGGGRLWTVDYDDVPRGLGLAP